MIKKLSLGLLIRLTGMVLTFFSGVLLARSLGVSDFGVYGIIISFTSILAIPSQSGFGNFIIKEVARAENVKDSNYRYIIYEWAAKRSLTISFVISILVIIYLLILHEHEEVLVAYFLGAISIILMGQNVTSYSYLKGIGRSELGQVVEALIYPTVFMSIFFIIWITVGLTLDVAMMVRCFSLLFVSFFGIYFVRLNIIKSKDNVLKNESVIYRDFKKQLIPLAISDGIRVAQAHLFILIVGLMLTTSDAGQFKVAQSLTLFLQLPSTVLITVLAPEISKNYNVDLESINKHIKKSKRLNILCSLLGMAGVILFASTLIEFAFGEQYKDVFTILVIIAVCLFISSFFGFGDVVLNMIGKGRLVLILSIVILLLTVVLAVTSMEYFGSLGAAYSFGMSLILHRALFYLIARKYSDIKV